MTRRCFCLHGVVSWANEANPCPSCAAQRYSYGRILSARP